MESNHSHPDRVNITLGLRGYGGISMMLHSFTCIVMHECYPSIEKFLVRPLKRMGEIYVSSIPKELLSQITINGVPGDQYNDGFEHEKPVLAPVKIIADLHRARSKSSSMLQN